MKKKPLEYEKPVLHTLMQGMGIDAATGGRHCASGSGPPAGTSCRSGNMAVGDDCRSGQGAGDDCRDGGSAAGSDCKDGSSNSTLCKSGGGV